MNGQIIDGEYSEYKMVNNKSKMIPIEEFKKNNKELIITVTLDKIIIKKQSKEFILNVNSEYISFNNKKGKLFRKVEKKNNIIYFPDKLIDFIK